MIISLHMSAQVFVAGRKVETLTEKSIVRKVNIELESISNAPREMIDIIKAESFES